MAKVALVYRVTVEDMEVYERVKEEIENMSELVRLEEEDIGFGIKALKPTFVIEEAEGEVDKLEERLMSIEGVSGIDVLEMSRI